APDVLFFFQAEDGIRDGHVTGVQTCALPISPLGGEHAPGAGPSVWRAARAARGQAAGGRGGGGQDPGRRGQGRGRAGAAPLAARSEERRVGKEWRWGWSAES